MTNASSTVAVPRPGSYVLAVAGGEKVTFGPLAACHKTFPNRAELAVQHADGEAATSYDFDLRLYPGQKNQHDERHIYRYGTNAVTLQYEQATVTCAGIKQSSSVSYAPQQTRVELPLAVGSTWRSTGGDSGRTEAAVSKVTGRTHVQVAGHRYLVYVIDTHINMSGKETGSRTQRWWYSPELAMPLKWHEQESGSRSGARYSADYTCTVVSTP